MRCRGRSGWDVPRPKSVRMRRGPPRHAGCRPLSAGPAGSVVLAGTGHLMRDAIASDAMRTTLDIADDVLQAAKERAQREKKTVGEMISELARRALNTSWESLSVKEPKAIHGLRPFTRRGGIVTNELIDKLRDDDAY